jgi:hypothetical protein
MLRVIVACIAIAALASPSFAEPQHTTALPEIRIGGDAPTGIKHESCVEVEIGSSRAFNCLNEKLKKQVDGVNPSLNTPPLDAHSPDIRIGVVNMPGVQQQYGKNFGVSVIPFRPAPPVFTPLGGHR